jgi:hypothetical protein
MLPFEPVPPPLFFVTPETLACYPALLSPPLVVYRDTRPSSVDVLYAMQGKTIYLLEELHCPLKLFSAQRIRINEQLSHHHNHLLPCGVAIFVSVPSSLTTTSPPLPIESAIDHLPRTVKHSVTRLEPGSPPRPRHAPHIYHIIAIKEPTTAISCRTPSPRSQAFRPIQPQTAHYVAGAFNVTLFYQTVYLAMGRTRLWGMFDLDEERLRVVYEMLWKNATELGMLHLQRSKRRSLGVDASDDHEPLMKEHRFHLTTELQRDHLEWLKPLDEMQRLSRKSRRRGFDVYEEMQTPSELTRADVPDTPDLASVRSLASELSRMQRAAKVYASATDARARSARDSTDARSGISGVSAATPCPPVTLPDASSSAPVLDSFSPPPSPPAPLFAPIGSIMRTALSTPLRATDAIDQQLVVDTWKQFMEAGKHGV